MYKFYNPKNSNKSPYYIIACQKSIVKIVDGERIEETLMGERVRYYAHLHEGFDAYAALIDLTTKFSINLAPIPWMSEYMITLFEAREFLTFIPHTKCAVDLIPIKRTWIVEGKVTKTTQNV